MGGLVNRYLDNTMKVNAIKNYQTSCHYPQHEQVPNMLNGSLRLLEPSNLQLSETTISGIQHST